MKPVPSAPSLPYAGRASNIAGLNAFDQDLTKFLFFALMDLARRANGSLPMDGSEPMAGGFDMGGFQITNIPATAWTPVLTFATPGDQSITFSSQAHYFKIGSMVTVWGRIVTSVFTHTTAAGELRVTGLPFAAATLAGMETTGPLEWEGITVSAGRTQINAQVESANSHIRFVQSGSATTRTAVQAGNTTSGTQLTLIFSLTYEAAS